MIIYHFMIDIFLLLFIIIIIIISYNLINIDFSIIQY